MEQRSISQVALMPATTRGHPQSPTVIGAVLSELLSLAGKLRHVDLTWKLLALLLLPYALFQRKLLPPLLARMVSRAYFWPTMPLTLMCSWWDGRGLWCHVDETVVLGVAPVALLGHPEQLKLLGVQAVVNMQHEHAGPVAEYRRLGIEQLRLPTVDHAEPAVEDLRRACEFIDSYRERGACVYLHCKAGHGRAAAVALAWLAYSRGLDGDEGELRSLNEELLSKRRIRKRLYQQANVRAFAAWLQEEGPMASQ